MTFFFFFRLLFFDDRVDTDERLPSDKLDDRRDFDDDEGILAELSTVRSLDSQLSALDSRLSAQLSSQLSSQLSALNCSQLSSRLSAQLSIESHAKKKGREREDTNLLEEET